MDTHKNAPLTLKGREAMVHSVIKGGLSKAAAARQFNTTPKTVTKWVERFRADGADGLRDHTDRSAIICYRRQPRNVPPTVAAIGVVPILQLRHNAANSSKNQNCSLLPVGAEITALNSRIPRADCAKIADLLQSSPGDSDDRAVMLDSNAFAEVAEMIAATTDEITVERITEFLPSRRSMPIT
jgi:transposase-like protein